MQSMDSLKAAALLLLALISGAAIAHGDEDHSHDEPAANQATNAANPLLDATRPQRLADGSLFIPKPAQRQLRLRTQLVENKALAVGLTFNGKVVADPNASGRVQAIQTGRIEAGPKGLPSLGQRVVKGETLAWLKPLANSLERGNQQALLAELDAQIAIARSRVNRLDQLEGALPQKEIEAARFELQALQQRRGAIGASLATAEKLSAPISGVISAAYAVPGQVVDAREMVFEIVDPARLMVEALSYASTPIERLTQASAQFAGGSAQLRFIGAGRQLREQAQPVLFRVVSSTLPLAIGQPVKVIAKSADTIDGVAVPHAALVKNSVGETVVWLHTGAENFVPRAVKWSPLDADQVVVTSGLSNGDRVVSEGASLLAQLR